ncbi:hypothetical protein NIES4071_25450 [Calothrix sp. NIES-4071]|nr:hypothetical protein NIES4071_25450 [Calothrix sp. NIES-4071]BAZ56868.1 hypothetical protein NIES4105_25390 [Calothrix sp. NIES-4105]
MSCDAIKVIYSIQADLQVEAANIAALVFPETEFKLLYRQATCSDIAFIFPSNEYEFLAPEIGCNNLSITFKKEKHIGKNINFSVCFFPKIKAVTLSGYYSQGMAHLIHTPYKTWNWFNGKGYKITTPDCIGDKFEFLAPKFYTLFEEFFLG